MGVLLGIYWVFIYIMLCAVTAVWAESKGRSAGFFFLLALVCTPLVGILAAAGVKRYDKVLEKEQITDCTHKRCPDCAEIVRAAALKCRYCGADVSSVEVGTPGEAGYRAGRAIAEKLKSSAA